MKIADLLTTCDAGAFRGDENPNEAKELTRRRAIVASTCALLGSTILTGCQNQSGGDLNENRLAALEARAGGRLGVCILDTGTKQVMGNRLDERFGMCSTFKVLLAALILREIEQGTLKPDQFVPYTEDDMIFYAPITSEHLSDGGMTVEALARAAQTTSDNVAANLLLRLIDGPQGFTERLRDAGDEVTRLDRYEVEMNLVPLGEVRDTTTPRAMAASLDHFLLGDGLSEPSQDRLIDWMRQTKTGLHRLRAGLPSEWNAGDKTGTGKAPVMVNKHNDVAIAWPPGRSPVIVTCYYDASEAFENIRKEDDAVIAEVGRLAADWIGS